MSYIVFFDLETGGIELHRPIIQVGAAVVRQSDWATVEEFEMKLLFRVEDCDPEALAINHYDPKVWETEAVQVQYFRDVFSHLLRRYASVQKISARGRPYSIAQTAGYNAAPFDGPRLVKLFRDAEVFLPATMTPLDVMQLVRWWSVIRRVEFLDHKLETICQHFGIELNAHDALGDVRATVKVARKLVEELEVWLP